MGPVGEMLVGDAGDARALGLRHCPEDAKRLFKPDAGVKFDGEKPRPDLLPPHAIEELCGVLTDGAEKYDDDNWHKVIRAEGGRRRYVSALMRHVLAYMRGEKIDPDSGRHHMAAAACNALFIVEADVRWPAE